MNLKYITISEVSQFLKNLPPLFMLNGYFRQGLLVYSKLHFNTASFIRDGLKNWKTSVMIVLPVVCVVTFYYAIDFSYRPKLEESTILSTDKVPTETRTRNGFASNKSGLGSDVLINNKTSSATTADAEIVLELIDTMVDADPDDITLRAENETRLLEQLEQSPQIVDELLERYPETSSKSKQRLIRELLATSQHPQVEQYALEQVASGNPQEVSAWLDLLRDTGLKSSASREHIFQQLEAISEPEQVRSALLAITPDILPLSERNTILDDLHTYTDHTDETIRSAAIETIGKWGDSADASTIKTALFDESLLVRKTAVQTAFTSTIRSEEIKSTLLNIMNNAEEDWHLRTEAHGALTGYTLDGDDYQNFFEFHQLRGTAESVSPKG